MKKETKKLDAKKTAIAYLEKTRVKKLLLKKEKRVVVLVSVGQTYHDQNFMKATVDLLVQQISQCRHIVENKEYYRAGCLNVDLAEGAWIIKVVPADTLQIRNLIEQRYRQALIDNYQNLDDIIEDQNLRKSVMSSLLEEWCKEGECYKNEATKWYQQCVDAGLSQNPDTDSQPKPLVKVILRVLTWHELFNETIENGLLIEEDRLRNSSSLVAQFQFWEAYDCLMMAYNRERLEELMSFAQRRGVAVEKSKVMEACDRLRYAVNQKGFGHLNRDDDRRAKFIKLLRPLERTKYLEENNHDSLTLRDGESLPDNLRDYILVEFSYLAHCLALGCGFYDQHLEQCSTFIMYPHEEPFPALQQVKALFGLIFSNSKKSEVEHLGFGVSNDLNRDLKSYGAVGTSQSTDSRVAEVQEQKKKFVINVFRGLDVETTLIKETATRKEFNLPFVDDMFVVRQEIHKQVTQVFKLKPTENTETREIILCCLQGMGGMGKSQIALDYCHNPLHDYNLVIWIGASIDKIDGLLHQLAIDLFLYEPEQSVSESKRKLKKYLSENPGWLLVLDGINDEILQNEWGLGQLVSADLPFFKAEHTKINKKKKLSIIPEFGGHVLIASQLGGWKGKGIIDVDVMDPESAVKLLKRRLGLAFSNADLAVSELAKKLGYYPLALAHAAAYILMEYESEIEKSSSEACIKSFIEKYEHVPLEVLNAKVPTNLSVRHDSVVRTLKMLIGKLHPGKEIKNSLVRELLSVMAFLDGDSIEREFLKEWVELARPNDQSGFLADLEKLKRLFFIATRDEKSYKMHGVVQDILLEMLTEEQRHSLSESIMNVIVNLILVDVNNELSWGRMGSLIPHANRFLELVEKNKLKINVNQRRILLRKITRYYLQLDSMAIASEKITSLEKLASEVDQSDNEYVEITAEILIQKASYCISRRKGAKVVAEEIKSKIKVVSEVLGEAHQLFQELRYNMGLLLYESGNYDEALAILLGSMSTDFLRNSRVRQLNCYANIATLFHKKARVEAITENPCSDSVADFFNQSILYFNKALEVHKTDPDPNIGYVYNGLHAVYSDEYNRDSNLDEAERCCFMSISESEKYKNREAKVARYTGWAYNNLSHIYCAREQLDKALECHRLFLEKIGSIVDKTEDKIWPETWADARGDIIRKLEKLKHKKHHQEKGVEERPPNDQGELPKEDGYLPGLK